MTYKQIFIGGITILGMYMLLGLMLNFPCKSEVPPVNSPVIITEGCDSHYRVASFYHGTCWSRMWEKSKSKI